MTIKAPLRQSVVSLPIDGLRDDQVEVMINRHMQLDVPLNRDLGRFSTTQLPKTTSDLLEISSLKNTACVEEYPSIASFQNACVSILAGLWNMPSRNSFFGTGTTGSSEAVMLAGLVMKRRWQLKHSKRPPSRPNVIIGCNAHLCIVRFADFFDVEARIIPVNEQSTFDPEKLEEHLDGNTIGVFLTLGSTYSGHYDPIERVCNILDHYQSETGDDIPIHVDAASGGFVAPFTESETFVWDFRLPRVISINASGHKYGKCPLAIGWIIWREKSLIPEGLIMESSYLRGTQAAFSLSFSKSSTPIVYQYFNFLQTGLKGYYDSIQSCLDTARRLSIELESTGYFHCISDIHRLRSGAKLNRPNQSLSKDEEFIPGLPVVVFRVSDAFKGKVSSSCLADLSEAMEQQDFSIPNYKLPKWGPEGEDIDVIRIVVRDTLTPVLAKEVMAGICENVRKLIDQ